MSDKNYELLAPAGSYDSFRAAVNAGADAVYMGGTKFGARAYADNPGEDMLLQAIREAHVHGRKLYLTVNTLLKDRELERELYDYLVPYYEAGLDGVIVQDLGVLSFIREQFPKLPIHASTQMTVTGALGAEFLKSEGVTRVVPARELSLEEIRAIKERTGLEIETFVHGALCYCYSGQCLFSSILGGRSGNRGRCAQPCRLPYEVWNGKNRLNDRRESFPLSMKDLCTVELLPDILEAGVMSLKIEGRMKQPEYTAGVVRIYRKYLDLYREKGRQGYRVSREDREELSELFNRQGFTDGYYRRQNGREMISLRSAGGNAMGEERKKELCREFVEREYKEKINGKLILSKGFHAKLILSCRKQTVRVEGAMVLEARNRPLTAETVSRQIQKTGNTPFVFENLNIEMEEDVFLPVQALNELRRNAMDQLIEEIRRQYRRTTEEKKRTRGESEESRRIKTEESEKSVPLLYAYVEQPEQFRAVCGFPEIKRIYVNHSMDYGKSFQHYVNLSHKNKKECFLALPVIFRSPTVERHQEDWEEILASGIDGFLIRSPEEYQFLRNQKYGGPVVLDAGVYTFNRRSREFWRQKGISGDTVPLELRYQEIQKRGCSGSELIIYGYLPLMVTAQCLHQTSGGCMKKPEILRLKDRYQKQFYVKNECRECYNVIYNSLPLSLLDQQKEIRELSPKALRLSFTVESGERTTEVARQFIRGFFGDGPAERPDWEFTRGHFLRGVE